MTFTIDSSHPGRTRIVFTSPYDFSVDLRFVDDEGASTSLAVAANFKPDDAASLTTFTKNLDPTKLATFVDQVAEFMISQAASLNNGS
ncbi:hypothetical protein [Paludisphaera borealis]|uniref:Uncharacterized protein n=1 Tax=Paludisphaera borealis TaxID=1387353 RepID=A0A1U7CNI4_9BACT|nr:hypothetical protein [Paludisphaera borealis]APW60481.1 hypothetical protein BSF38_01951 [Paludisphaera borealis]